MKKLLFTLIVLTSFIACNSKQTGEGSKNESLQGKEQASVAPGNLQTVEFKVDGMSCEGCENAIKGSVGKCPGVQDVQASATNGNAVVKFDKSKTNTDDLKKAIEKKGYTVTGSQIKP
ncbi:MAG: cation transporter [Bacteroidia bacterium]|nr:cation transporter [Bacteroidia bacterium]